MTSPAPAVDYRQMLPADWCDRMLAFTPGPLLVPYVEHLQAVVRKHGATSIMIERIQELARFVCGTDRGALFEGHTEIFGRIEEAGGLDPLQEPLNERSVEKQMYEIVEDIESVEAEWLALDALALRGWTIDPFVRGPGSADWRVSRGSQEVEIDVKNKASRSAAWMRLTWALRGAALCPQHQFLNAFRWHWDVPESCRGRDASQFMRFLWEAFPKLDAFLHQNSAHREILLARDGWSLVVTRDEERTDLSFTGQRDAGSASQILSLGCEANTNPELFFSGSSSAAFLEEFGADARQTLSMVFGRLGIGKQAAARTMPTLFLIVWHVPFMWEPHLDYDQLQVALDMLTTEQSWPAIVLWPLGRFEMAKAEWVLNDGAKRMLQQAEPCHPT